MIDSATQYTRKFGREVVSLAEFVQSTTLCYNIACTIYALIKSKSSKISTAMGKKLKPSINSAQSPFRYEFGVKVGSGQDNFVRLLQSEKAANLVVKISQQKGSTIHLNKEVLASALYKKKKYEMLKLFLGDYVPESQFLVGHKTDGIRPQVVPKSYTIQERVPNVRLRDLNNEQQSDPRLLRQLYVLLLKLQNMYVALETVNKVVGRNELDGKLDLGGISKYAREGFDSRHFDAAKIMAELSDTPNLLVDPENMQLYCIDFDDGTWGPEKEAAKGVLEHLAHLPRFQDVINIDPNFAPTQGLTAE